MTGSLHNLCILILIHDLIHEYINAKLIFFKRLFSTYFFSLLSKFNLIFIFLHIISSMYLLIKNQK